MRTANQKAFHHLVDGKWDAMHAAVGSDDIIEMYYEGADQALILSFDTKLLNASIKVEQRRNCVMTDAMDIFVKFKSHGQAQKDWYKNMARAIGPMLVNCNTELSAYDVLDGTNEDKWLQSLEYVIDNILEVCRVGKDVMANHSYLREVVPMPHHICDLVFGLVYGVNYDAEDADIECCVAEAISQKHRPVARRLVW